MLSNFAANVLFWLNNKHAFCKIYSGSKIGTAQVILHLRQIRHRIKRIPE